MTIKESLKTEIRLKGSVFIGSISPANQREEAESFVENCKKFYHAATHNCFAFRISETDYRFSDDGEPSGTAGNPIFRVLEKRNLFKVVVVVTRYFGGTKLGRGGLIRAYRQAAEKVVSAAKTVEIINYQPIKIKYSFQQINQVEHLVQKYKALIQKSSTVEGMVSTVEIRPSQVKKFQEELMEATSGKVELS